jgi:hypothetical protein
MNTETELWISQNRSFFMELRSYSAEVKGNTIIWPDGTPPPPFNDGHEHKVLVTFIPVGVSDPDEWYRNWQEENKEEIIKGLAELESL